MNRIGSLILILLSFISLFFIISIPLEIFYTQIFNPAYQLECIELFFCEPPPSPVSYKLLMGGITIIILYLGYKTIFSKFKVLLYLLVLLGIPIIYIVLSDLTHYFDYFLGRE